MGVGYKAMLDRDQEFTKGDAFVTFAVIFVCGVGALAIVAIAGYSLMQAVYWVFN